jgi:hypothetical protein
MRKYTGSPRNAFKRRAYLPIELHGEHFDKNPMAERVSAELASRDILANSPASQMLNEIGNNMLRLSLHVYCRMA